MKSEAKFLFNIYPTETTLESIISKLKKEHNIFPKDFSKIKIDLDWGGCFYEGDTPEIKVTEDA